MDNKIKQIGYEQLAQLVKKECIKTVIDAYETALQNGVCREGARCGIDSMKSMKVEEIIKSFLSNSNQKNKF